MAKDNSAAFCRPSTSLVSRQPFFTSLVFHQETPPWRQSSRHHVFLCKFCSILAETKGKVFVATGSADDRTPHVAFSSWPTNAQPRLNRRAPLSRHQNETSLCWKRNATPMSRHPPSLDYKTRLQHLTNLFNAQKNRERVSVASSIA